MSDPVERTLLTCTRCGYRWFKKTARMPRVCPKCRSVYWDVEKTRLYERVAKYRGDVKPTEPPQVESKLSVPPSSITSTTVNPHKVFSLPKIIPPEEDFDEEMLL